MLDHAPMTVVAPLTRERCRDHLFWTKDGTVPGIKNASWTDFKSLVLIVRSSYERCTLPELRDALAFSKWMTERHLGAFGRVRANHNFIILEKHEDGTWSLRGPSWKEPVVRPTLQDIIAIF